jgi:hypothetical protein
MSRFALFAALVVPVCAWSQPAGKPVPVESAYVEIVPTGSSDADDILAVERGVELVLCQAGLRRRVEGREAKAELKLVASLAKAELDANGGRCEITNASATLPGGAGISLPDMALARPTQRGRRGAESLFLACGASFTRAALDVLKDRISVRGSGCETKPEMKKGLPRRPFK